MLLLIHQEAILPPWPNHCEKPLLSLSLSVSGNPLCTWTLVGHWALLMGVEAQVARPAARCCLLVGDVLSTRLSRCISLLSVRFLFISCNECLEDWVDVLSAIRMCWVFSESYFHFPQRSSRFSGTPAAPWPQNGPSAWPACVFSFLALGSFLRHHRWTLANVFIRDASQVRYIYKIFVVVETGSHVAQVSLEFTV